MFADASNIGTVTVNPAPLDRWIRALRHSHDRLAGLVASLDDDGLKAHAYPSEWSVAQVLSHLGSGAEIFATYLTAGEEGTPAPTGADFEALWDTWNAKPPAAQARAGLAADQKLIDQIGALDDDARQRWQLDLFGSNRRLTDLVAMRLNEHAVHTWDVAVALDDSATLAVDAVDLIIDELGLVAQYTAKPPAESLTVRIHTEEPTRMFRLEATSEAVRLSATDTESPDHHTAMLKLPAEALVRLIYGRLDDKHMPPLVTEGVDIATLRRMFPGP
jgi:uncharacterized protein (TIGR03083 family)